MGEKTILDLKDRHRWVWRNKRGMRWLAGYPRSGTSLIRTILHHCFGHVTATTFEEQSHGHGYGDAVGLVDIPMTEEELAAIRAKQGGLWVKTHSLPLNLGEVPYLLIVRDPRCVLPSLHQFLTYTFKAKGREPPALDDVIAGGQEWGNWSLWHRMWIETLADHSYIMRFEDVLANIPEAVKHIGGFTKCTPIRTEIPPFHELHAKAPNIFRRGKTEHDLPPDTAARIEAAHGEMMKRFGYLE